MNSRLDAMQAAILSVKLPYLNEWSEKRREAAEKYNLLFTESGYITDIPDCCTTCEALGKEPCDLPSNRLVLPKEQTGAPANNGKHIYHQYTIRVKNRDEIMKKLQKKVSVVPFITPFLCMNSNVMLRLVLRAMIFRSQFVLQIKPYHCLYIPKSLKISKNTWFLL